MEHPSLLTACAHPDTLFATPPETLLHQLYQEFPSELNRLKRAYSLRDPHWTPPPTTTNTPSPSHILFQETHDEVNRTLTGFQALVWIHLNQYSNFVASQPPEAKLTLESFTWLREFYNRVIVDAESLYTLIVSIITNDLGKDPHLATEYRAKTGIDISHLNHDAILLRACEAGTGLIDSLERLPESYKEDIMAGIELGATFNFGQLAQAENAPVALSALLAMRGRPRALQLRFMEQVLDLAGAAGHMDWTSAKKLTQPIFDSYRNVFDACEGVVSGALGLAGGYDLILGRRAEGLRLKGFRVLQVEGVKEDRALVRLLCMGNVTTVERAWLFQETWDALDEGVRQGLVDSLNMHGCRGNPAVQLTYMPAFLSRIRDGRALGCALRYLCRAMVAADVGDPSAVVIERSVLGVLKRYVENGKFDGDPTILEQVNVPEGVVAQRA